MYLPFQHRLECPLICPCPFQGCISLHAKHFAEKWQKKFIGKWDWEYRYLCMPVGKTLSKPSCEVSSAGSWSSRVGHRVFWLCKGVIEWCHPFFGVVDELKSRHQAVLTYVCGLQGLSNVRPGISQLTSATRRAAYVVNWGLCWKWLKTMVQLLWEDPTKVKQAEHQMK